MLKLKVDKILIHLYTQFKYEIEEYIHRGIITNCALFIIVKLLYSKICLRSDEGQLKGAVKGVAKSQNNL